MTCGFVARVTRRVHTNGEGTAYASGASDCTCGFGGVRIGQSYRVVCYRSSFVRLSFFFLSLYSLLFFVLQLLVTLFVSSVSMLILLNKEEFFFNYYTSFKIKKEKVCSLL